MLLMNRLSCIVGDITAAEMQVFTKQDIAEYPPLGFTMALQAHWDNWMAHRDRWPTILHWAKEVWDGWITPEIYTELGKGRMPEEK